MHITCCEGWKSIPLTCWVESYWAQVRLAIFHECSSHYRQCEDMTRAGGQADWLARGLAGLRAHSLACAPACLHACLRRSRSRLGPASLHAFVPVAHVGYYDILHDMMSCYVISYCIVLYHVILYNITLYIRARVSCVPTLLHARVRARGCAEVEMRKTRLRAGDAIILAYIM